MKKVRVLCLLCAMFCLVSCEKDKSETIINNLPAPSWTATDDYDMSSSMTAIIRVDLSKTYPTQVKDAAAAIDAYDVLAAFIGEQCVGVCSPKDGLFYLYMGGLKASAEGQESTAVTLRYYSAILKNKFIADETVPFVNDAHIGSVAEPYTPAWKVEK